MRKAAGFNSTPTILGRFFQAAASIRVRLMCNSSPEKGCQGHRLGGCTVRERMNGHRLSIKNNEDTPVAVHFTHRDHSWRVTVLERAPTDIVQRRLLEKLWINRLRGSQLFTVLNRDDGLGILVLWTQTWFCQFLCIYFLCQFLHFLFSPCACVNLISSFLLLPLLGVISKVRTLRTNERTFIWHFTPSLPPQTKCDRQWEKCMTNGSKMQSPRLRQ